MDELRIFLLDILSIAVPALMVGYVVIFTVIDFVKEHRITKDQK